MHIDSVFFKASISLPHLIFFTLIFLLKIPTFISIPDENIKKNTSDGRIKMQIFASFRKVLNLVSVSRALVPPCGQISVSCQRQINSTFPEPVLVPLK